jgi:LmbE family N-acetylglucosaminyl deacetylase
VAGIVYLSPHLDDAVLSCGGRIAREVSAGRRVRVVTLFTSDEPEEPPSQLAADLRRWWKLPPGEVMRRRRAEDLAACALLGAEPEHWDLPEAPYRCAPDGRVLYPSLARLFGEPDPADDGLVAEIATRIGALAPEVRVLGPLAVGGHVDHRLVRRALERVRPQAPLYEDFPYVEWKWLGLRRALGRRKDWIEEVIALADDELAARFAASCAYASQVPTLFRTPGRLRRQLRRAARRAGGERIWRRRSPASAASCSVSATGDGGSSSTS